MNIEATSSIFLTLSNFFNRHKERTAILITRSKFLDNYTNKKLVKVAFDTRRIDQEIDYNPRRGLQYYHRSDPFVSKEAQIKITAFTKLNEVLTKLKLDFGRAYEWQDSYARILHTSVNNGLRTSQSDGDFSEGQPSMGSLDYLDELLYMRYRLTTENIMSMSNSELRSIILCKDAMLDTMAQMMTLNKKSEDNFIDRSSIKENIEKDKTITITIKV